MRECIWGKKANVGVVKWKQQERKTGKVMAGARLKWSLRLQVIEGGNGGGRELQVLVVEWRSRK